MRVVVAFAGLVLVALSAWGGEGSVRRSGRPVPGSYIVVLDAEAGADDVAAVSRTYPKARIRHTFARGLKGFAFQASDADAIKLSRDPRVAFVEEDSYVSATTSWGLDRVDQRFLPLDDVYAPGGTGAGVTVYVVDTGIADHSEFTGRLAKGFTAVADGNGTADCNGHGTHVAGIVAGSTYGVAASATLVPVRVLDCRGGGTASTVLAGLEWILQQPVRPAVVNMSLGGALSSAVDREVASLVAAGLTTVVAAGNQNLDACGTSPARVPGALTVGATNETDARASFSNFGSCVDLFAPGVSIVSAWKSSSTDTAIRSGTSASAPFVTGAAALLLEKYPAASPGALAETIRQQATEGVLEGASGGSPNLLLYAPAGALADEPPLPEQLLADPGFEYGDSFWSSDICAVVKPTGCSPGDGDLGILLWSPRKGEGHAAMGGPATSFSLLSEAVTVPSDVRKADLSFFLWIVSKKKGGSATDILRVEIRDAQGTLLESLGTFSNLDACASWLQRHFDVTRYRGQTIRVAFAGVQAQGAPTWFYLDDVTIDVER